MKLVMKLITLFCILSFATISVGCGGGGGGGGNPVSPNLNTTTTISGNVVLPSGINNALISSVRANSAIDYTKLKVKIASGGQEIKSVSVQSDGKFQITFEQSAKAIFELYVLNSLNNEIMACLLEDVDPGKSFTNITIDTDSTAIFLVIRELNRNQNPDNLLKTKDLQAQISKINQVINALKNFYTNQTSGTPLNNNDIKNTITAVQGQIIPGISQILANYKKMKQELENNQEDATTRVNKFMSFISVNFVDSDGKKAYNELKELTESRLDRYLVNDYRFDPMSFEYVSQTLNQIQIRVKTKLYIKVTRKPGKEGGFAQAEVPIDGKDIIWEYDSNQNKWLIIKGLPFRQNEVNI